LSLERITSRIQVDIDRAFDMIVFIGNRRTGVDDNDFLSFIDHLPEFLAFDAGYVIILHLSPQVY
jgi:hypothetical protein